MHFLPSEIIRKLDSETIAAGVPGEILMERAGYGAYKFLTNVAVPNAERFLIFAGKGNNAGDAFVIARYLIEAGKFVETILLTDAEEFKGDALLNFQRLSKISSQISSLQNEYTIKSFDWHGDVIIDGIFGTGISGEVKGIFRTAIQKIDDLNIPVFSLDIPSGLNCDTGEICGVAVKAKWTVTFALAKLGMLTDVGAQHCGRVEIIDIGIPADITDQFCGANNISALHSAEFVSCIPQKLLIDHKNKFGHLLIIAGSKGLTGAAILSAKTAISSGAGLVTLAVPASLNQLVVPEISSCMTLPVKDDGKGIFVAAAAEEIIKSLHKFDAVALGPGIGTDEETVEFVSKIIPAIIDENSPCRRPVSRTSQCGIQKLSCKKLIIDADALNILAKDKNLMRRLNENVVITPHPGEFERLTGVKPDKSDSSRIKAVNDFIKNTKLTLLLKGFHTVISNNNSQNTWINLSGNPGMATAGSGDVLTGIIGAFLAQGFTPEKAAVCGAYIHGISGDIAAANLSENSVTAEEIINYLGKAFVYVE